MVVADTGAEPSVVTLPLVSTDWITIRVTAGACVNVVVSPPGVIWMVALSCDEQAATAASSPTPRGKLRRKRTRPSLYHGGSPRLGVDPRVRPVLARLPHAE